MSTVTSVFTHPGLGRGELHLLHPALWRAHQLGHSRVPVTPSGHALLDAELPGGGWPHQALTELLLPHPGVGEIRLLSPALAALSHPHPGSLAAPGHLLFFGPPALPSAWALAELGWDTSRLLVLQPPTPGPGQGAARCQADLLWALEQALASGQAAAVLAWLPPRTNAQALRRLQLAAQAHEGPAFLLRDAAEGQRASPAPLRLQLAPLAGVGDAGGAAGGDVLEVRLLKRRGPACAEPLHLPLQAVREPAGFGSHLPVGAPHAL